MDDSARCRLLLLICLTVAMVGRPDNVLTQIHHVKELNTTQLKALDRPKTVVLLPGGILEQHGPYLLLFTDGYQNERLTQDLTSAIVERPDGLEVSTIPRYADVMTTAPANIAIDADALGRGQAIEQRQTQWLGEWRRRRGGR